MSTTVSESQTGGQVGNLVAVAIICLVLGGAVGYYTRYFTESSNTSGASSAGPPRQGAGMMGGMGGMMGGGGGGGGGQNQPGPSLARLVRNLSTVQEVQNKRLTADQAKTLGPML